MSSIAQIGPVPSPLIARLQHRLEDGLKELRGLLLSLGSHSKAEQIHDIRIATRRQGVLCRLLSQIQGGPEVFQRLEHFLKELTQSLSSVRSWDVSAQQLKGIERHWRSEGKKDLGFLRKILKKQVKRARDKHLSHLSKEHFFQTLDPHSLAPSWDLLSVPEVEHAILEGVQKFSKKVLKKWDYYQRTREISDLHQFRISLKRLRYFLEIQISCLDHADEAKVKQLKSMQDRLGYIHDLYVLQDHLGQKVIRKRVPSDKKDRYCQVQKFLNRSLAAALKDFQKGEGKHLHSLLQGEPA